MTLAHDTLTRIVALAIAEHCHRTPEPLTGADLSAVDLRREIGTTLDAAGLESQLVRLAEVGAVRMIRCRGRVRVWPALPELPTDWRRSGGAWVALRPGDDVVRVRETGGRWTAAARGKTCDGLTAREAMDLLATATGDLSLLMMPVPTDTATG